MAQDDSEKPGVVIITVQDLSTSYSTNILFIVLEVNGSRSPAMKGAKIFLFCFVFFLLCLIHKGT